MKFSKVLHVASVITGFLGIGALLIARYGGTNGIFFGMNETHLFNDATVLVLIAIWSLLGSIHHMKLEEKGEFL